MVMALQNFTINCTVEWKQLNCTVDDGYAPALDQGTFCTVNDQPLIECKVVAICVGSLQMLFYEHHIDSVGGINALVLSFEPSLYPPSF